LTFKKSQSQKSKTVDKENLDPLRKKMSDSDHVVNLREYLELQSDEEDIELKKKMSRMTGGKIKQYKKEKSLGILCQ
jgi:hypothetical protein